MSRMACTIADSIAQCRGLVMPLVPKSALRCSLGAKFGSSSEKLAITKSDKVDSTAKVALRPIPSVAKIDSSAGKKKTACMGSCEKSTKPVFGEAAEICVLLKPNLLEDMDACAKFVNGKMAILAAESMLLDQEDTKDADEVAKAVAAEAYSSHIQDLEHAIF
ncbi:hypothetical protein ACFX2J_027993 [Malus domestica]